MNLHKLFTILKNNNNITKITSLNARKCASINNKIRNYSSSLKINSSSSSSSNSTSNSTSNMRFVQFYRHNNPKDIKIGIISENGDTIKEISSDETKNMIDFIQHLDAVPLKELQEKYENIKTENFTSDGNDDIKLLAPITNPDKIIAIALNYKDHCDEQNKPYPKEPVFFTKFASNVVGPNGNVIAHSITNKLDWEAELAIVIGKNARNISPSNVDDYIFGYTVAQDISARDWFKVPGQYLLCKSMDTFCPLGPAIIHKSLVKDPQNLSIKCKINGNVKQFGNTKNMICNIGEMISFLSKFFTLKPGDVILTGTPAGVGVHRNPPEFLKPGDVIETEIKSVGKLVTNVVSE